MTEVERSSQIRISASSWAMFLFDVLNGNANVEGLIFGSLGLRRTRVVTDLDANSQKEEQLINISHMSITGISNSFYGAGGGLDFDKFKAFVEKGKENCIAIGWFRFSRGVPHRRGVLAEMVTENINKSFFPGYPFLPIFLYVTQNENLITSPLSYQFQFLNRHSRFQGLKPHIINLGDTNDEDSYLPSSGEDAGVPSPRQLNDWIPKELPAIVADGAQQGALNCIQELNMVKDKLTDTEQKYHLLTVPKVEEQKTEIKLEPESEKFAFTGTDIPESNYEPHVTVKTKPDSGEIHSSAVAEGELIQFESVGKTDSDPSIDFFEADLSPPRPQSSTEPKSEETSVLSLEERSSEANRNASTEAKRFQGDSIISIETNRTRAQSSNVRKNDKRTEEETKLCYSTLSVSDESTAKTFGNGDRSVPNTPPQAAGPVTRKKTRGAKAFFHHPGNRGEEATTNSATENQDLNRVAGPSQPVSNNGGVAGRDVDPSSNFIDTSHNSSVPMEPPPGLNHPGNGEGQLQVPIPGRGRGRGYVRSQVEMVQGQGDTVPPTKTPLRGHGRTQTAARATRLRANLGHRK